jgi:shikimate kinase
MIVYLLGHSGVGKSNAVRLLSERQSDPEIIDLDDEFRGREFNWEAIEPRLRALHDEERSEGHVVVDVGAGTQTLDQLRGFLQARGATVVIITAPPDEVIKRQPVANRSIEEFIRTEYVQRAGLFALATLTIDVAGMDASEAARAVTDQVLLILDA